MFVAMCDKGEYFFHKSPKLRKLILIKHVLQGTIRICVWVALVHVVSGKCFL